MCNCVCICDVKAARDGMLNAVRVNLDDTRTHLNDVDDEGFTALHYAARYNRLAVVEVLVKAGAGLYMRLLVPTVLPLFRVTVPVSPMSFAVNDCNCVMIEK